MSHLHRFIVEDLAADAAHVVLTGEEAHHAVRVTRVRPGDAVCVFDGKGLEVVGECEAIARDTVRICAKQTTRHAPPRVRMTLAVGGLHRDKPHEEIIRRATELGAWHICFWHGDHSQRPIKETARWRKVALEACKQCGRPYLPTVYAAPSLDSFLSQYQGPSVIGLLTQACTAPSPPVPVTDRLALLVGPEGDFSAREQALALNAGAQPVSLGAYAYRSEVAATALLTIAAFQLGDFGSGVLPTPES